MSYFTLIKPDTKVDLSNFSSSAHEGLTEVEAVAMTAQYKAKLEKLQELLYAAGKNSLLIVLQGRDTSGKDGTIRSLSSCLNVQHTDVSSFKQPTPEELSHDFLWRIHRRTPVKGKIAIFNRSQYEDVLAVRVHQLVPKKVWKERYDRINEFEKLLVESDTIILKFYLHISKEEQETRLLAREADADKSWKLSAGDWKERRFWKDYTEAYEEVLSKTSHKKAPWILIPADHKWFRDLCITQAMVDALEPYKKAWKLELEELGDDQRKELNEMRQSGQIK